jgi:hypothetical protein
LFRIIDEIIIDCTPSLLRIDSGFKSAQSSLSRDSRIREARNRRKKKCGLRQDISKQYSRMPLEPVAFLSLKDEAVQETLLK